MGVKIHKFVWVAKTRDFPEGKGRVVNVGHKLVGVFKVDGKFYAVNDVCPTGAEPFPAGPFRRCA